jgi:hypothetical protein
LPSNPDVRSSIGIEIGARPEVVFRIARDPLRWAALLPHYVRSRLVSREPDGAVVAAFVARRPLVPLLGIELPVAWRSRTWSEPEAMRLRFRHLGGATRGMDVTWRIEPVGDRASRVTIEHDFRPRLAVWATVVERLFVRPIAGRTLTTFKALAETLDAATSGPGPEANPAP